MMVIPSNGYVFHLSMSLSMGMFFNLKHTHPGVDKSSQVPGGCCPSERGNCP